MNRTLGLDLGTDSLGWAILDDITGDIIDKGVVIFPEGADSDAGTSVETPAAKRRAARMARRMKFRRKLRKWALLKVLIDNQMCPLKISELDAWKKLGKYPLDNNAFLDWLKATNADNPYCDRAAAANGKVDRSVLGRALYHICQRRGFKSSRKDASIQRDEETGEVKDKNLGAVKGGIAALSKEIVDSGAKTLGEYFYKCLELGKDALEKKRIRCRYTDRIQHYEKEFAVIMAAQQITENSDLYRKLHKSIFDQRPLRSQKHLVGNCPLEPKCPRVQIGHPSFEEFRMLAFVNNLTLEDKDGQYRDDDGNFLYPLTVQDRETVCKCFFKAAGTFKFGDISKQFKKDSRFKEGFKFHYYRDDDAVSSCSTRHKIRSAFGEAPYDEQKVFDALMFYDDDEKLQGWFKRHYPALDETAIVKAMRIHPKDGNASYSLKAIRKMLPFLRKGYGLTEAKLFAKLPDLLPDYAQNEDSILLSLTEELRAYRAEKRAYGELESSIRKVTPKPRTCEERYHDCLVNRWGLSEDGWCALYSRDEGQYKAETEYKCNGKVVKLTMPRLPAVNLGMIRNPMVQRSMTTLRRLVNYLGDHGKIGSDDTIRIELARSVNDFASRRAIKIWQENQRKERADAEAEIVKQGVAVTEDAIERYLLWKEQGQICLYTGDSISIEKLLVGNEFDIEHTVPRSLCGDDSMANKTICQAKYNRQTKKGQVPQNCPNWEEIEIRLRPWYEKLASLEKTYRKQIMSAKGVSDPAAHSNARTKALVTRLDLQYWRDKLHRFELKIDAKSLRSGDGLTGFKKRQLVDAGIMSSHAVELLKSVYPATFAVNGAATAFARKAWGIQDEEKKNRNEHTHHAVDAMVIAALKPARFTAICTALKDDGAQYKRECDVCPEPFPDFAKKVRAAKDEILVKHVLRQTTMRQSSKRNVLAKPHPSASDPSKIVKKVLSKGDTVRGQLHKDTFYGRIAEPSTGQIISVQRVPIPSKVKDAEKIVGEIIDPVIRECVRKAVESLSAKGETVVPDGCVKMPSGVPIKRVRIKAAPCFQNPLVIRTHSHQSELEYKRFCYAASAEGVNFRSAIFLRNGVLDMVTETSLEWAKGHRSSDYKDLSKLNGFVGFVHPGEMAIVHNGGGIEEVARLPMTELRKRLYYIRQLPKDGGTAWLQYHLEARRKTDIPGYASQIDVITPSPLLRISKGVFLNNMLFEGIHFKMMLDGAIKFLK